MQKVILFDINETVLDLSPLRPKFKLYLNNESHMDTWFAMLLHSSTVSLITGVKTNFKRLAHAALVTLAARLKTTLSDNELDDIVSTFANLPPHDDISPSLTMLRHAGFKLVAFSNSSLTLLDAQLTNANIIQQFDDVISVESAGTFKPSKDAYQYALQAIGVSAKDACLVATHDWDTHGALCAGLNAAFINRFNTPYNAIYKKPTIIGDTMTSIAQQIIDDRVK